MADALVDVERLLSLPDEIVQSWASVLAASGFDAAFLGAAEAIAPRRLDAVRLPLVHAWLRGRDGPAAVLARLFAYRDDVSAVELQAVVPTPLLDAWSSHGVLRRDGDRWRSRVRTVPFFELWISSDDADASFDPVMGPGATTSELGTALPERLEGSVLDVGCGAGSLALLAAARGASEVVGVDIDPRAVAWSRFNARLNRRQARFETGDLLEPVAGAHFDWIVAQPPFVPCPPESASVTYLHGGRGGDELAFRLIRALPGGLTPTGRAVVRFDAAARDTPLGQRIGSCMNMEGLQVVLAVARGFDADALAIGYASVEHADLGLQYRVAAVRYREHLRAEQIERVDHALLWIRRRPGAPAVTATVTPRSLSSLPGAALSRLEAALETAARPPDELDRVVVAAPADLELAQIHPLRGGDAPRLQAQFAAGHRPPQELSEAAVALLQLLTEPRTVTDLVQAYAGLADTAPARVREQVHGFLREALIRGLVEPC